MGTAARRKARARRSLSLRTHPGAPQSAPGSRRWNAPWTAWPDDRSSRLLRLRGGADRLRRDGGDQPQSRLQRAVPHPRLLQRRRALPPRGGGVPRDDPGHRLCRRGRGAVPLRRDDAGCGLHPDAGGLPALRPDRGDHRRYPLPGAAAGPGRLAVQLGGADAAHERGAVRHDQHPRAGAPDLHGLHLPVPGGGHGPPGRDDRGHRPDPSREDRAVAPAEHRPADRACGQGGDAEGAERHRAGRDRHPAAAAAGAEGQAQGDPPR